MSDDSRIPTNLRTLLILEILGKSDRPMTATEINDQLGLPKQTVHRLCTTLEEEGFLMRVGQSKRFYAARRLRTLGAGLLHNSRHYITRHQILLDVAAEVGETVNFVVPEDDGMNYLDRVETDWAFRIQLPVGTHVPFHCTASGKCFLASLAKKARTNLVHSLKLTECTKKTHVSASSLLDELNRVSDQGYAIDDEEFMDGMVAIAVPVTDSLGRYVASLAFHGPTQRMSIASAIERKDVLLNAAEKLRNVLFSDEDTD
jgi:DNA-binding IclR family transcriptional regulator